MKQDQVFLFSVSAQQHNKISIDDLKSKQANQESVTRQVAELETESHRVAATMFAQSQINQTTSSSLQDHSRQLEQMKSKQADQESVTRDNEICVRKLLAGKTTEFYHSWNRNIVPNSPAS